MTPRVVILSSPSGGGKTTIAQALLARRPDIGYSVSATTRPPRAGEKDGRAYHFLTREQFERRRAAGEFLEWAVYAGELYGTLRSEVESVLRSGRHVLMDIEVNGTIQVRRVYPPPPTYRMRKSRLAMGEVAGVPTYDHWIINDVVETAVAEVGRIVGENGQRKHGVDQVRIGAIIRGLTEEVDRIQGKEPE